MKFRLLSVIILMFCFCCACANEMADSGQAAETDESLESDSYTFPPDDDDFAWMLKESGMADNWYIRERPSFLGEPDENRSIHLFSCDMADCSITARHEDGIMRHGLDMSITLKTRGRETPNEDYKRFETEELPKVWILAGNIIGAQEEAEQFEKECMSYYYEQSSKELTEWSGRQGNIKCDVSFGWYPELQQYALNTLWLYTVDDF